MHLLYLMTQRSIKPGNDFFHDRKNWINDTQFHQKQSETKSYCNVGRTNYVHSWPAETDLLKQCFSCSVKFQIFIDFFMYRLSESNTVTNCIWLDSSLNWTFTPSYWQFIMQYPFGFKFSTSLSSIIALLVKQGTFPLKINTISIYFWACWQLMTVEWKPGLWTLSKS